MGTNEQTEAQKVQAICPRSQTKWWSAVLNPGSVVPESIVYTSIYTTEEGQGAVQTYRSLDCMLCVGGGWGSGQGGVPG